MRIFLRPEALVKPGYLAVGVGLLAVLTWKTCAGSLSHPSGFLNESRQGVCQLFQSGTTPSGDWSTHSRFLRSTPCEDNRQDHLQGASWRFTPQLFSRNKYQLTGPNLLKDLLICQPDKVWRLVQVVSRMSRVLNFDNFHHLVLSLLAEKVKV